MITDARAEQAFEYLRDHTAAIGQAKADLERAEILRKRVRKRFFLTAEGPVAVREAFAEVQPDTERADDDYIRAVGEYETIRATHQMETIALDVWRTESANRRRA